MFYCKIYYTITYYSTNFILKIWLNFIPAPCSSATVYYLLVLNVIPWRLTTAKLENKSFSQHITYARGKIKKLHFENTQYTCSNVKFAVNRTSGRDSRRSNTITRTWIIKIGNVTFYPVAL